MGAFDIYERVHLKVGNVSMKTYRIGDEVSTPDGIYFGHEGVVVILNGILVTWFANDAVFDKWGNNVVIDLDLKNPVAQVVSGI